MKRYLSVDIFRGLTVALMIFVNCIDADYAHPWFVHATWHGCTLADMVFPFFLLIVGVSIALAMTSLCKKSVSNQKIISKIVKRSMMLFAVGVCINAFPLFNIASVRIFGVLQRIAICYFVAALLFLFTSTRAQAIIALSILIGYWLLMTLVPVPGYGASQLSAEGNLATYIDRLLIPAHHLYLKQFEPEGILTTLPAIATTLLDNLLGIWLVTEKTSTKHLQGILLAGVTLSLLGGIWHSIFPINKTLWSSSYVLWTAGIAYLAFAFLYWLIEIKQYHSLLKPFEYFGQDAMTAFILHVLFLKLQAKISLSTATGGAISLRAYLTQLFPTDNPHDAAFGYAFFSVVFWFFVIYLKQIFLLKSLQKRQ